MLAVLLDELLADCLRCFEEVLDSVIMGMEAADGLMAVVRVPRTPSSGDRVMMQSRGGFGRAGAQFLSEEEKWNAPKVTYALVKQIGSYLKPYRL